MQIFNMMMIRSLMILVPLYSAFILQCQCTLIRSEIVQDLSEIEELLYSAHSQRSHVMQASSPPDFFATGYIDGPQHNIGLFDFKVGYEVQLEITAPDHGRFHLDFIDDTNKNIVLAINFHYS